MEDYNVLRWAVGATVALLFALTWYRASELPFGIGFRGDPSPVQHVEFLADLTWVDHQGDRHFRQQIFDRLLADIQRAEHFILLDMFLFNDFLGKSSKPHRRLSDELSRALIDRKTHHPAMQIILISDPVNTVYGGLKSRHFEALSAAGVDVVITDLDQLRDSNPVYSTFWRLMIRPFGNSAGGFLPNPMGDGKVSARSWLRLVNFKANHRKVAVMDVDGTGIGYVTSANPHDGSSAHHNVAVRISGPAVNDLLATERVVLELSGRGDIALPEFPTANPASSESAQLLTERAVKDAAIDMLSQARAGDQIDLVMFYLSDRDIVQGIKRAANRGVSARVILDPNKDAFGMRRNGIPNRSVGAELHSSGVDIRWCDTHGEQCHSKMLIGRYRDGQPDQFETRVLLGSANFTRRNLDNFNLETNLLVSASGSSGFYQSAQAYFDLLWNNEPGRIFSVDYGAYRDESRWKYWLYRFMEFSGLSTF
ncbi:MAG: phospholipase D-like domain-containing protein [bacterium]